MTAIRRKAHWCVTSNFSSSHETVQNLGGPTLLCGTDGEQPIARPWHGRMPARKALAARQAELDAAEEEWLALELLREEIEGT